MALGNWGSEEGVPLLVRALTDPSPLVRGHAAWALGKVATDPARAALSARLGTESDEAVTGEISSALADPRVS